MTRKTDFMGNDFLLHNDHARELYYDYASKMPIIDYHNHLSAQYISEDKMFDSITEAWIGEDHYKWRAMRTLGVQEKYITGNGSPLEKFEKWAYTVPYTLRNPLYHWTHMELDRYFGIQEQLSERNAKTIFQVTSEQLNSPQFSCRNLLDQMNVEVLCTTEDPTDTLEHHKNLAGGDFHIKVSTAFRPDKAIAISSAAYNSYLESLEATANCTIHSFTALKETLLKRMHYFNEHGCKLSDHGLSYIPFEVYTDAEVEAIFQKRHTNGTISKSEEEKYQTALMLFLCESYHDLGWVQQFHLGALRNNNSRMKSQLGPDSGWDSIGDFKQAVTLSKFLDALDSKNKLSKTILYNLNPSDNEVLATMTGNFNDGSVKGKIQFGSGWWFLDQKDGIIDQLNTLSNMGLLSCFIGMLTDSRSFLSFPRHEYFRRILCNLFGEEIQKGLLPNDPKWIGKIIQDICHTNAKTYFDF